MPPVCLLDATYIWSLLPARQINWALHRTPPSHRGIPSLGICRRSSALGFCAEQGTAERIRPHCLQLKVLVAMAAEQAGEANGCEKYAPKLLTLVIIHKDGRVLLGMKKRGFGEGYYNGFGGKVENGETIEQAAARELEEEAGVSAVSMEKRGILTFHFDDKPLPWEVHVYHVEDFVGEPYETEEMCPCWFSTKEIPFEKMWKDDPIWYPHFLQGSLFRGNFVFQDTHNLVSHTFKVVSTL